MRVEAGEGGRDERHGFGLFGLRTGFAGGAGMLEALEVVELAVEGDLVRAALAGCGFVEAGGFGFAGLHEADGHCRRRGDGGMFLLDVGDVGFKEGGLHGVNAPHAPKGLGDAEGGQLLGRRLRLVGLVELVEEGAELRCGLLAEERVAAEDGGEACGVVGPCGFLVGGGGRGAACRVGPRGRREEAGRVWLGGAEGGGS